LSLPGLGWAAAEGPPEIPAPAPPALEAEPDSGPEAWVDDGRVLAGQGLGFLVDRFDHFFGDDRLRDAESPSSRFRFKTYARTAEDRRFAMGFAVGTTLHLPHLERWANNARLVLVGERGDSSVPPLVGTSLTGVEAAPVPPTPAEAASSYLSRGRGSAELRVDLLRRQNLILDSGTGVTMGWPLVPFARVRAHLRATLGAGFLLRGTESIFVELWGRGPGTSTDLEVGRLLTPSLRLRWEGHGVFARRTRGVEWSTLVGADWKVHPRTGLFTGVGASGFGTPSPGLDLWRTWVGVRQDIWAGWVFAGLEPEMNWPRAAGMARRSVWAVTVRLEVVLESGIKAAGARS
jgi:hypothetical protein